MLLVRLTSNQIKYLFVNVFAFSTENISITMMMMVILLLIIIISSSILTFITIKDLRLMPADWIFIIHQTAL